MAQVYRNDLLYSEERFAILGAVMAVFDELGNGYVEPVYQDALELEFQTRSNEHMAQTINYLKTTGLELALLANFGSNVLERKWLICSRIHNTISIQEQR